MTPSASKQHLQTFRPNWLPFACDSADLVALDEGFAEMLHTAANVVDGAAVVETRAGNLATVVPPMLHDSPMWVIFLPDHLAGDVDALLAMEPQVGYHESVDLLTRRTTLEWHLPGYSITLYPEALRAIDHAYPDGSIVMAFVTRSRTSVRTLRCDDEFVLGLQVQSMHTGPNYCPGREHSAQELDAARTLALLVGNAPLIDMDGRTIVPLKGFSYMYDPTEV
jgi:hypothetical protein